MSFFYFQFKYKTYTLPWVLINLQKDDLETAEVYVTDMFIGNLSFSSFGLKPFIDNINDGIRNAIILVNENQFSGRKIKNIELLEDGFVIKGEKHVL